MIVSRSENKVFGSVFVIIAAIVICLGWSAVMMFMILRGPLPYRIVWMWFAGLVFLLVMVFPYHRWVAPISLGHVWTRRSVGPLLAVVAIFAAQYGYGKLTHQHHDQWSLDVPGQPLWSLLLIFLVIFPLTEEIMARGFLLNIFRTSRPWTLRAGVVVISLLYAGGYAHYPGSVLAEMIALSCTFGWARISSDGLLLPVLLNTLVSLLGMLFAWLG